jgi:hypothetical protein
MSVDEKPLNPADIRRDAEAVDRGDFPDGTVLGDLRDYGDLGGRS